MNNEETKTDIQPTKENEEVKEPTSEDEVDSGKAKREKVNQDLHQRILKLLHFRLVQL